MLTRDEVERLLAQPRGTEPAALRDRALLELMYACGLRASEAIGIEVSDLDLELALLRARGKGSKERVVPIGRAAVQAVKIYLERGRPAASPATIHRKAACLRSFYRHLHREGVLDSDPTAAISSPRRGPLIVAVGSDSRTPSRRRWR